MKIYTTAHMANGSFQLRELKKADDWTCEHCSLQTLKRKIKRNDDVDFVSWALAETPDFGLVLAAVYKDPETKTLLAVELEHDQIKLPLLPWRLEHGGGRVYLTLWRQKTASEKKEATSEA